MHIRSGLVLFIVILGMATARAHIAAEEMAEAAAAFLNSLSPELKQKATYEFKSDTRFDWHYVPKERKGVALKELDKAQQALVHEFLDSALSRPGLLKANAIMALEKVLFDLEKKNSIRDAGAYYIIVFGTPSPEGTWAWRFEGHHLSFSITIVNGEFVTGTPTFMGANPAEIKEGPTVGTRPLGAEEDIARELIHALEPDQRERAIFAEKALREIVTGAKRSVTRLEPAGLALAEMNRSQSELLLKLTREYIYRYRPEIADDYWKRIQTAGFESIHFAWAGSIEKGQAYYYRVQGPTFLLECDNIQNKANHIHTVWRDFQNDFGEDLLKKHYKDISHANPGNNP